MSKFFYIGMIEQVVKQEDGSNYAKTLRDDSTIIGDHVIDNEVIESIEVIEGAEGYTIINFKKDAKYFLNYKVLMYNSYLIQPVCMWFETKDEAKDYAMKVSNGTLN